MAVPSPLSLCLLVHEVSMHVSGTSEPHVQKLGCPVTEGNVPPESDSTQFLRQVSHAAHRNLKAYTKSPNSP